MALAVARMRRVTADTSGFQGDPGTVNVALGVIGSRSMHSMTTCRSIIHDRTTRRDPARKRDTGTAVGDGSTAKLCTTAKGGPIAEETRVENVFRPSETTGTVWFWG